MNKVSALLFVSAFAAFPGVALACPNVDGQGVRLPDLHMMPGRGVVATTVAGGGVDLGSCYSMPGYGFVADDPDFTIRIQPAPSERVVFETQADCDATLLVRTANRNTFFDDDDGPGTDARITLRFPSPGLYNVWLGTVDEDYCSADLSVWTEPRDSYETSSYEGEPMY
jgi:hypothetical protein